MSKWVAGGRERRELQAAQRRVSVDVKQPSESEAKTYGDDDIDIIMMQFDVQHHLLVYHSANACCACSAPNTKPALPVTFSSGYLVRCTGTFSTRLELFTLSSRMFLSLFKSEAMDRVVHQHLDGR